MYILPGVTDRDFSPCSRSSTSVVAYGQLMVDSSRFLIIINKKSIVWAAEAHIAILEYI